MFVVQQIQHPLCIFGAPDKDWFPEREHDDTCIERSQRRETCPGPVTLEQTYQARDVLETVFAEVDERVV